MLAAFLHSAASGVFNPSELMLMTDLFRSLLLLGECSLTKCDLNAWPSGMIMID
jgi:hypothetical protein